MRKIITVVGARPQFIKTSVVSQQFDAINQDVGNLVEEIIVHTGQHHDANMSESFFADLKIKKPYYNLGIHGGSHGEMTAKMISALDEICLREKPTDVLVYGDTNSTLAAALTAAKLNIPVTHVEAGLRSHNRTMPEEINRIVTDHVSTLLFCPTIKAMNNLKIEGLEDKAYNVGDVMFDAAIFYSNMVNPSETISRLFKGLCQSDYLLATIHRAANTDDYKRLHSIVAALEELSEYYPVVLPLHPRTRRNLQQFGLSFSRVRVIDPVSYFDMLFLLKNCLLVLTDSGGVQKEAYFFKKYCVTLRDETEWVELVDCGANKLVGANYEMIVETVKDHHFGDEVFHDAFYGEGNAAEKIVEILLGSKTK